MSAAAARARAALPPGVVALGFVSLFMDVSSEMIHALLPLFLTATLGASALAVGLISGAAEAAVAITKLFSGVASDWLGRRKPLILAGYGLAALTKPAFALAGSAGAVFGAHLADRVGKGIRGAPRDALIADITAPAQRGAAFGLRQSMDTTGAFLGPLVAIALMALYDDDIRAVFAWAVVPALAAVATIVLFVREPARTAAAPAAGFPISRAALGRLGARYWWVVAAGCAFMLARFSEAFLLLRAADAGVVPGWVPAVLVVMNLVYALAAWPLGAWSDRRPRVELLALGLVLLAAAHGALALGAAPAFWLGVALWGLHMGATQGVLAALVAEASPAALRGSAFGLFNLATGLSMLAAGALAGLLWTTAGAGIAFGCGAGLALVALAVLLPLRSAA